jgi:hypothetical protein
MKIRIYARIPQELNYFSGLKKAVDSSKNNDRIELIA